MTRNGSLVAGVLVTLAAGFTLMVALSPKSTIERPAGCPSCSFDTATPSYVRAVTFSARASADSDGVKEAYHKRMIGVIGTVAEVQFGFREHDMSVWLDRGRSFAGLKANLDGESTDESKRLNKGDLIKLNCRVLGRNDDGPYLNQCGIVHRVPTQEKPPRSALTPRDH